ncbi:MAG: hypothetical protein WAT55_07980 [Candidatus Microthrix parvicella]
MDLGRNRVARPHHRRRLHRVEQHLRVRQADGGAHPVQQNLGSFSKKHEPVAPRRPQPESMPIDFVWCCIEHSVQLEQANRIVEFEATRENGQPLLNLGLHRAG